MTLLPGAFSDHVQITLSTAQFAADKSFSAPRFEALSYAWGAADDPVGISVYEDAKGGSRNGYVRVTQNLATALPYLRHENEERVLWIDAICVNQQDLVERSNQVRKMADIYSRAERVVVWLGPESENSANALQRLHVLGSHVTVDWTSFRYRANTKQDRDLANQNVDVSFTEEDFSAIHALFCRSWFERLWVRQEVQLATVAILVCGYSMIPWNTFRNAVRCLYTKLRLRSIRAFSDRLNLIENIVDYSGSYTGLGRRAYSAGDCKCSDERDRIFAILGVLHHTDKERWSFEPNYTSTLCQVYEDVSFSYMEAWENLHLMDYCDLASRDNKQDLPTWVPDWTSMSRIPYPFSFGFADCGAPGDFERNGKGVLRARGLYVATIERADKLQDHVRGSYTKNVVEIRRISHGMTLTDTYVGGGTQLEALRRTFRANRFSENRDPPDSAIITEQQSRSAFSRLLECSLESFEGGNFPTDVEQYLFGPSRYWKGRSFVVTETGYIGLAPAATKSQDLVCVLLGCRLPLVIRPLGVGSPRFQVIGHCYIDSLMAGQAFLGPLPEPYRYILKFQNGDWLDAFLDERTKESQCEDPRWELLLGEDYRDKLGLKGMSRDQKTALLMSEAMNSRGIETTWFEFV